VIANRRIDAAQRQVKKQEQGCFGNLHKQPRQP
jgi:hypothetical protein